MTYAFPASAGAVNSFAAVISGHASMSVSPTEYVHTDASLCFAAVPTGNGLSRVPSGAASIVGVGVGVAGGSATWTGPLAHPTREAAMAAIKIVDFTAWFMR